jgi:hypothetical protein
MKSRILSFLGIGAVVLAVACKNSGDETTNKDSSSTTTVDNKTATGSSAGADVQTSDDGRRYVLRKRSGSGNATSADNTATTGNDYDTVWLYSGTEDRYYTLHGSTGRDTLYYNSDEWNSWWNNSETDNELKSKSGDNKVKVEKDGSWKVKDGSEKTKMNDAGKVKTKPKG